ncbi:MAG: FecR family protein [Myxococcaceae bacterium]|nr:FecR family protein [Myxococcaceae bacterium]
MTSLNLRGTTLLSALLVPWLALASVGTISRLDGTATRTPKGGATRPLVVGSTVELNDTLKVSADGNLKLTLTDQSVVMLGGGSELRIDEATFAGQDRKGFSAYLSVGKVWASVKKALAGSDAKFEVTTDRAVAGVRGTIFRVDAIAAMKATSPAPKQRKQKTLASATVVRVEEGRVAVEAQVRKAKGAPGNVATGPQKPSRRVLVAGPQEVSAEEWERRFVELQRGQQVTVGMDLWEEAQVDAAALGDAFGKFVDANRSAEH